MTSDNDDDDDDDDDDEEEEEEAEAEEEVVAMADWKTSLNVTSFCPGSNSARASRSTRQ